ncbi:MAG: FecR domain-containing protein [Bacteroidales bacterium]
MNETISYELLARYFSGECTGKEKNAVERWKIENRANEKAFTEFAAIWENSQTIQSGFNPDAANALDMVNRKLERLEKQPFDKQKQRGFTYYVVRIAAFFILSLAIWYGYNKTIFSDSRITEVKSDQEIKELLLSDGTKITLNSNSTVRFPEKFGKKSRDVELEGEAYFEVARNPQKPFIIKTQSSVAEVLGTSFNLRARPGEDEVILSVAEGKVAFSAQKNEQTLKVTLEAGETGIWNKPVNTISEIKSDDQNYMAWKTGILRFGNTPLTKVAKDLMLFYNADFQVENVSSDSVTISIDLNRMTVEEMIEAMENIGVTITRVDDYFLIKPVSQ